MTKQVTALNTISGQVEPVPATYIDHPILGKNLVAVPDGTKSYDPEFYQPTDRGGFAKKPSRGNRKAAESADEAVVVDATDPFEATLDSDLQ